MRSASVIARRRRLASRQNGHVAVASAGRCRVAVCRYCQYWFPQFALTQDHVLPRSAGHTRGRNVVLACEDCNAAKGDRRLSDFARYVILGRNDVELTFPPEGGMLAHLKCGVEIVVQ